MILGKELQWIDWNPKTMLCFEFCDLLVSISVFVYVANTAISSATSLSLPPMSSAKRSDRLCGAAVSARAVAARGARVESRSKTRSAIWLSSRTRHALAMREASKLPFVRTYQVCGAQ